MSINRGWLLTSDNPFLLGPIHEGLPIFVLLWLLGLARLCVYCLPFALVNRLRGFAILGHRDWESGGWQSATGTEWVVGEDIETEKSRCPDYLAARRRKVVVFKIKSVNELIIVLLGTLSFRVQTQAPSYRAARSLTVSAGLYLILG